MERLGRVDMILELLESNPEDLFLNYALGLEYVSASKFTEATEQFNKVLQLDSTYIPVYYQMGKLSEALSNKEEAIAHYQKGLALAKQKKDKSIHEFEEAIFMLED
jgi:tetratricopeptide (TPR) repeat protein